MPEFTFLEYGPAQADDALIEQATRFLRLHVWRDDNPAPQEIDYLRSYHLAIAIDAEGKVAAAGTMLGSLPECYMADIATAPEYRRQYQLGSTILGMLEDKGRALGAQRARVWALPPVPETLPGSTAISLLIHHRRKMETW